MHTAQTKLILYLVVEGSYIKGSLGIGDWSELRGHDVLQVVCHDTEMEKAQKCPNADFC